MQDAYGLKYKNITSKLQNQVETPQESTLRLTSEAPQEKSWPPIETGRCARCTWTCLWSLLLITNCASQPGGTSQVGRSPMIIINKINLQTDILQQYDFTSDKLVAFFATIST